MATAIYPEGIRVFSPREKSPDFVKGSIVITPNQLVAWLKANPDYLKDYKGEKQLRLQILDGKKGLYVAVDTYEAKEKTFTQPESDLPF